MCVCVGRGGGGDVLKTLPSHARFKSAVAFGLLQCPCAVWARHETAPVLLSVSWSSLFNNTAERKKKPNSLPKAVNNIYFISSLLSYFISSSFFGSFISYMPPCWFLLLSPLLRCLGYFLASPWKRAPSQPDSRAATNPKPDCTTPSAWEGGVCTFLPQNWAYNTAASHNVCQRTVCVPKVDDSSKSGVCITDSEEIWFAHYHPESGRGEHLLTLARKNRNLLFFLSCFVFFPHKTKYLVDLIVVILRAFL